MKDTLFIDITGPIKIRTDVEDKDLLKLRDKTIKKVKDLAIANDINGEILVVVDAQTIFNVINQNYRYYDLKSATTDRVDPIYGQIGHTSWYKPFNKPIIIEHGGDPNYNYEVIGRILTSTIIDNINYTGGYIADKNEIVKIKDGRRREKSVGFLPLNKKCSICGSQVGIYNFDGTIACENKDTPHTIGEKYDGSLAYIIVDEGMVFRESSYTYNPATLGASTVSHMTLFFDPKVNKQSKDSNGNLMPKFNTRFYDSYNMLCDTIDIVYNTDHDELNYLYVYDINPSSKNFYIDKKAVDSKGINDAAENNNININNKEDEMTLSIEQIKEVIKDAIAPLISNSNHNSTLDEQKNNLIASLQDENTKLKNEIEDLRKQLNDFIYKETREQLVSIFKKIYAQNYSDELVQSLTIDEMKKFINLLKPLVDMMSTQVQNQENAGNTDNTKQDAKITNEDDKIDPMANVADKTIDIPAVDDTKSDFNNMSVKQFYNKKILSIF